MSPKSPKTMREALLLMAKAITLLASACPPGQPAYPMASRKRARRPSPRA